MYDVATKSFMFICTSLLDTLPQWIWLVAGVGGAVLFGLGLFCLLKALHRYEYKHDYHCLYS